MVARNSSRRIMVGPKLPYILQDEESGDRIPEKSTRPRPSCHSLSRLGANLNFQRTVQNSQWAALVVTSSSFRATFPRSLQNAPTIRKRLQIHLFPLHQVLHQRKRCQKIT
ncbi:unnamed protein product [Timema podura]|uniref:Uncharacterized protein n=1 Tax=Timema podura TaxID=61482 RepID=A0ABN7NNT0_TIMPD|nr:unnamed protein product [Timema podura]